jgi:dipeptidyl aminopeptidase/acylaminoacyl peptidase
MNRLRAALLAATTLLAFQGVPGHAADPTVIVAARDDGALVRVAVTGRVGHVTVLVPGKPGTTLIPTQANGSAVSYVSEGETRWDVGVVDAGKGTVRPLSHDGRSGHLLVSHDGRYRYVLKTNDDGALVSLVRTDAAGGYPRTLVAGPTGRAAAINDVQLSGMGISPDGRTIYVARTAGDQPSVLLAVDTATGRQRVLKHDSPYPIIENVVASPDGKTLAVTFSADDTLSSSRVGLVPVAGGAADLFPAVGDEVASAFTADGTGVLLTFETYPVGVGGLGRLSVGDVRTKAITPIAGTDNLFYAVPVA